MPEIGKEEKTRGYSRKRNLWRRGGGRQNLIWGIGAVGAKMQVGVCQRRGREKLHEGGGS